MIKQINNFNGFDNLCNFKYLLNSDLIKLDCLHTNFNDKIIKEISNKCKDLEFLRFAVDQQHEPIDETLCLAIKTLPNLKHLYVINCSTINDHFVEVLSNSCKNLKSLGLRGCSLTNKSMNYLKDMPLTFLDIRFNPQIDFNALKELNEECAIVNTLTDLFVSNLKLQDDTKKFKKLKHFTFIYP